MIKADGGLHTDSGKGGGNLDKIHAYIFVHDLIVEHSLYRPVLMKQL